MLHMVNNDLSGSVLKYYLCGNIIVKIVIFSIFTKSRGKMNQYWILILINKHYIYYYCSYILL